MVTIPIAGAASTPYVIQPGDYIEAVRSKKCPGPVRVWDSPARVELLAGTCRECGVLTAAKGLVTRAARPGGRTMLCIACDAAACAAYNAANRAARLEGHRRYNAIPERKAASRERVRRRAASGANAAELRRRYAANAARTPEQVAADRARLRPDGVYRCRKCREWLPFERFSRDIAAPTGLQGTCRACHDPHRHARVAAVHMDNRDNYACAYCGAPAEHVDHIHPLARGGADAPENMQWACAACNLSKHDADLFEWRPDLYELVKDWACVVCELPPRPGSPAA